MGTRPRRKQKQRRRLERWQVLLAAIIAAVASIAVALISVLLGGSPGTTRGVQSAGSSQTSISLVRLSITGLSEQTHPPPPGRMYVWTGTVSGQSPSSSVNVIDKVANGEWLVSPDAVIAGRDWTVSWILLKPPASARWTAVVSENAEGAPCCFSLSRDGPNAPQVVAIATSQPAVKPASPIAPASNR
jgi:hypothetical protein